MSIECRFYEPFAVGSPSVIRLPDGASVHDIAHDRRMPIVPDEVRIDGHPVPKAFWPTVRPKPGVALTLHTVVQGGGGGGKNILATVAAIGLTIATSGIAGGAAAGLLGSSFAAGTIGATLLAGAVAIAGGLLLQALFPPPSIPTVDPIDRERLGAASVQGNVLEPNGPIPRVIGTRKIFPPLAVEPYAYYDGNDEVVEALYVLAGPHAMNDVRIDGTPIDEASDVEYRILEGWQNDPLPELITTQTKTVENRIELSKHVLDGESDQIIDINEFNGGLPIRHVISSRFEPDRVQIHIEFPQGLSQNGKENYGMRIPFRIRFREKGTSTWTEGPELQYKAATLSQIRTTIELVWQDGEYQQLSGAPRDGWRWAGVTIPGQTVVPTDSGYSADDYFKEGIGGDFYLDRNNQGSSDVINVELGRHTCRLYLDEAQFPRGIYEIELIRGCAFEGGLFDGTDYTYNGADVYNFFTGYQSGDDLLIAQSRDQIIDQVFIRRTVSVWDQLPMALGSGLAVISLRARNRNVERVSVEASGYVKDWSGTAWETYTTTSNPAPHYRDVLAGLLNFDPIPTELIDDDELVAWRSDCATNGYTCDHISEGQRQAELLGIIAGCGFAKPLQTEVFGVVRDFDRTADAPIQIFTPRNMNDFRWTKAFARLPDGLRANFVDENEDFQSAQIIEYRPNVVGGARLEQVSYQGLPAEADVRRRMKYDIAQLELRSVNYSWNTPVESIICRRGSLVGVATDVLVERTAYGRVMSVVEDGAGNVVAVVPDTESSIDVGWSLDMLGVVDMLEVEDMLEVGQRTGIALRGTDGTITTVELSKNSLPDYLVLETPLANAAGQASPFETDAPQRYAPGILFATGILGKEYRRMIVSGVQPGNDLTATISAVDEADSIWDRI